MLVTLVNTLFDEIKQRNGLRSDAALARYLATKSGETVSEMAIVRWRQGKFPKGLDVLGPQILEYSDTLKQSA